MTLDLSRTLSLLSSMYLCKPSKEALENWKKMLSEDTPYFLSELLKNTINEINLCSEKELEDLLWEYTRLFIGPYKLPCPPWESVYTSPKRLMMQDAYDDVRAFYAEMGLAINDQNVMYDHIGAELNFLAVLYENIDDCPEKRFYYENLAKRFLAEHILKWIPQFADDMEKASDTAYYKVLALATKCIIQDIIKDLELTAESKN